MNKDRLVMYKETYYNELSRREKFTSELTIPIAIITLLFGSITYVVGKLESMTNGILMVILVAGLLVLIGSLIVSVTYLIRSLYNYSYEYMATSKQIEEYYNTLTMHYKNDSEKEKKIEKAFDLYLINDFCKCNERNTSNNDKRSFLLHKSRTALIVALVTCAITMGACNFERVINTTRNCIEITAGKEEKKDVTNIKSTGSGTRTPTPTSTITTTN